jgi:hypothetical protein
MTRWAFWRHQSQPVDTEETSRHLARAHALEERADRIIARERHIIRENHLAPRIRAALKERRT